MASSQINKSTDVAAAALSRNGGECFYSFIEGKGRDGDSESTCSEKESAGERENYDTIKKSGMAISTKYQRPVIPQSFPNVATAFPHLFLHPRPLSLRDITEPEVVCHLPNLPTESLWNGKINRISFRPAPFHPPPCTLSPLIRRILRNYEINCKWLILEVCARSEKYNRQTVVCKC